MSARFQISAAESVKLIVKTCLEEGVTDHGQIAHVLGQCEHETHFIYAEEINGPAQARRLGYNGGANYFGRGYIQITHIDNYRKFHHPELRCFLPDLQSPSDPAIVPSHPMLRH